MAFSVKERVGVGEVKSDSVWLWNWFQDCTIQGDPPRMKRQLLNWMGWMGEDSLVPLKGTDHLLLLKLQHKRIITQKGWFFLIVYFYSTHVQKPACAKPFSEMPLWGSWFVILEKQQLKAVLHLINYAVKGFE